MYELGGHMLDYSCSIYLINNKIIASLNVLHCNMQILKIKLLIQCAISSDTEHKTVWKL